MLGIGDVQQPGMTGDQIADIVQGAQKGLVAGSRLATAGTRATLGIATLPNHLGLGQVFDALVATSGPYSPGPSFVGSVFLAVDLAAVGFFIGPKFT
jgi:hypothetical protein